MKYREAKDLAGRLAKFYAGQLNDGQGAFAVRQFQAMEYGPAAAAVDRYCRTEKTIDIQTFFDTAFTPQPAEPAAYLRETPAAVYRRQNPAWADCGDAEVILSVYRVQWLRCGGSDAYRSSLTASCRNELIGLGTEWPPDRAERAASFVAASADQFREMLADVRPTDSRAVEQQPVYV